ncbi:MAG: ATP-binding protein [Cyanobacteria bacterium J06639_18]
MNNQAKNLFIKGIPKGIPEDDAAVFRSRLFTAVSNIIDENHLNPDDISITIYNKNIKTSVSKSSQHSKYENDELSIEKKAKRYQSQQPLFTLEKLVIPDEVREDILSAIDIIRVQSKVFVDWNLQSIEPFPRTALNFHGQPGTGKTLTAHAIAHNLGKPIMVASYAQIESKFLGDGSKNVEAIFYAAERDDAVLFIDEADSLLSKRLTNANQGSERAANSICSQLLICLEKFKGVVIFATNLVENYDKAFETRVRHIHFPMPNEKARHLIWQSHLPPELPLAGDFLVEELASIDDVCGRDIKNAVIDAAVRSARNGKSVIQTQDLIEAINRIKASRIASSSDKKLDLEAKAKIEAKLKVALSNREK